MTFKAVLFDLDGTLLDTLDDLADAANAVLRRNGFPPHPREAYRYFVGDGMAMLAQRAMPNDRRDEPTVRQVEARIRVEYTARMFDKTRPYPGIPDLLDCLAARGLPMAVLSNKPEESTTSIVRALLGRWDFAIVRGEGPSSPKKPDPAGAVEIARRLGIPAEHFLYLGDTATDMKTALGAGMFAVGALWGFRDEVELREAGAQSLVKKPEEVVGLLETASQIRRRTSDPLLSTPASPSACS